MRSTFILHQRLLIMKAKQFSCIALQHRGAKKIYEETKNLTIAEELAYWQQHSNDLQQQYSKKVDERSQPSMS